MSCPFPHSTLVLNYGPFPPLAFPSFLGTTGLSVSPVRPAHPSPASGWSLHSTTHGASRVASVSLLYACCRQYPGGIVGCTLRSLPPDGSLPRFLGGSASALRLSRPAQRSLTLRPAYLPSHFYDPRHRALKPLRCLCGCSDCYRLERQLPGGIRTR